MKPVFTAIGYAGFVFLGVMAAGAIQGCTAETPTVSESSSTEGNTEDIGQTYRGRYIQRFHDNEDGNTCYVVESRSFDKNTAVALSCVPMPTIKE